MGIHLWIIVGILLLTSAPLIAKDDQVLVVKNAVESPAWKVSVSHRDVDLVADSTVTGPLIVSMQQGQTYFLQFTSLKNGRGVPLLIPTAMLTVDTIRISLYDDSVDVSVDGVYSYSASVWKSLNRIHGAITATHANVRALDSVAVIITALPKAIDVTGFDDRAEGIVRDSMVGPALAFVQYLKGRIEIFEAHLKTGNEWQLDSIRQVGVTDGLWESSDGAFLVNRQIKYSIAQMLMGQLEKRVDQRDEGATTKNINDADVVRDTRNLSTILGEKCRCEVAYIATRRLLYHVEQVNSCNDSAIVFLRQMASARRGNYCNIALDDLQKFCSALNVKSLSSISGLSRDSVETRLVLHPDSIYLLHFWGTWCKPCIEQREEIAALSDSLSAIGVSVLHLNADANSRFSKWTTLTKDDTGVNIFIEHRSMDPGNLLTRLYVRSFPSYLLIAKNGMIAERLYGYPDIMDKVLELKSRGGTVRATE